MFKTAIVLGGSGLVGSKLVNLLINDNRFDKILIIGRRKLGIENPKVTEIIVDFNKPDEWTQKIQGDVLFSAFGTTIKKAGSQDNQFKIDYSYQWQAAKAAVNNGVSTYVLISSVGANAHSKVFYSRMKGELDRDVKLLPFKNTIILKPSLLVGERNEHRTGERFAAFVGKVFTYIPYIKKYRPIQDKIVAEAMLNAAFSYKGSHEFVADELFKLAGY